MTIGARMAGDNLLRSVTINDGMCNACRHVRPDGATCRAFPKGIPIDVLFGRVDHRAPVEGDRGVQFERRD